MCSLSQDSGSFQCSRGAQLGNNPPLTGGLVLSWCLCVTSESTASVPPGPQLQGGDGRCGRVLWSHGPAVLGSPCLLCDPSPVT